MRLTSILFVCLALAALGGCREKQKATESSTTAPAEGAPREKVAIEAPADGSARDAKVTPADEAQTTPPATADPNRKYEEGVTESDLGLPFYPGSEEVRPGGRFTDSAGTAAQSFRKTGASVAEVVAFYRKHLKVVLHEVVDASSTTLIGEADGMQVTVIAVKRPDRTEVSVFTKRPSGR